MALEPHSYSDMQMANELWHCCCQELQNDLQNMGITVSSSKQEIIAKVKDLAMKTPNWLLNLCEFFKMAQRESEGMCQYAAWLKGAADLCDFMVGSGEATVSYIDQMVLGQLVASGTRRLRGRSWRKRASWASRPASSSILRISGR